MCTKPDVEVKVIKMVLCGDKINYEWKRIKTVYILRLKVPKLVISTLWAKIHVTSW